MAWQGCHAEQRGRGAVCMLRACTWGMGALAETIKQSNINYLTTFSNTIPLPKTIKPRRNHPRARVLRLRCQNATHRPPNLARTPNTMIMLMGHRHPSRRFLQLSFSGKKTMAATASQAINAVHHADARRRYGQSASLFRRQNAPRRVLSIRPGVA